MIGAGRARTANVHRKFSTLLKGSNKTYGRRAHTAAGRARVGEPPRRDAPPRYPSAPSPCLPRRCEAVRPLPHEWPRVRFCPCITVFVFVRACRPTPFQPPDHEQLGIERCILLDGTRSHARPSCLLGGNVI